MLEGDQPQDISEAVFEKDRNDLAIPREVVVEVHGGFERIEDHAGILPRGGPVQSQDFPPPRADREIPGFPDPRTRDNQTGMEIQKSAEGGVTTIKLKGEIDLHGSPVLREEFRACAAEKAERLLLDFTDVSYIDSSGLATLIEYVRESGAYDGKLALFGLQKKVRTIFDLVRLNELFVIKDSREEAVAAIAGA